MRRLSNTLILTILTLGVSLVTHARPAFAVLTITLDHQTLTQNPTGLIRLKRGSPFSVVITNTSKACFEFNQKIMPPVAGPPKPLLTEEVPFELVHDGVTRDYTFEAVLRAGAPDDCKARSPHKWTVTIVSDGWSVAFAGGFTADQLTDPVFSLEPGQSTSGTSTQTGFFVHRDRKSQDSWSLGAAAMVHLYYSDPDRFRLLFDDINWVPVSFGLGINNSSTRYFLGTGARFDTKFFLIAGAAIGSVARLPNGITEGGFTTNSNALSSLGKRTSPGFFLALSYSFIDTGTSNLLAPFKTKSPAPAGGGQ